jgi:hypothetical protein
MSYATSPRQKIAVWPQLVEFPPEHEARLLKDVLCVLRMRHQRIDVPQDLPLMLSEELQKPLDIFGRHLAGFFR